VTRPAHFTERPPSRQTTNPNGDGGLSTYYSTGSESLLVGEARGVLRFSNQRSPLPGLAGTLAYDQPKTIIFGAEKDFVFSSEDGDATSGI